MSSLVSGDGVAIMARGLGNGIGQKRFGTATMAQTNALLILELVTSCISLVSSGLAVFWFMRMKRSFRHHLILFLVLSDAFKAVWYLIFPIVYYSGGAAFAEGWCTAQGFFLSMAIESADLAILFIALHTAWYVFRPPQRLGQGGLYPYRHYMYVIWIALPILAASLAFTNKNRAYISVSTYCYLPKRPFWFRLALSWIPRYLIFFTIFFIYAAIYIHVHLKFRGFGKVSAGTSAMRGSENDTSTPSPLGTDLNRSAVSPFNRSTADNLDEKVPSDERPEWERVDFITGSTAAENRMPTGTIATDFGARPPTSAVTIHAPRSPALRPDSGVEINKPDSSGTGTFGIVPALEQSTQEPKLKDLSNDMTMARIAIQRQLRFMFIYPLIYILLWIFPFVNHCLQYSDYYVLHPPYWLQFISVFSLTIQAAADAWVFSWKERPWRRKRTVHSHRPVHRPSALVRFRTSIFGPRSGSVVSRTSSRLTTASDNRKRKLPAMHWLELEARLRKDSVLLGDDVNGKRHRGSVV